MCRSLSHRYFCIVAVQHSHSGKIGSRFFFFFSKICTSRNLFLRAIHLEFNFIIVTDTSEWLVPPNPSRIYEPELLLPGAQGLPSHWHSGWHPTLNPQPHPSQFPLHLQYPPLLPTHLMLFLMRKALRMRNLKMDIIQMMISQNWTVARAFD